jgi:hypothetical protein
MQFLVDHIHCKQTTEQGHDEVYMIIGGATFDANDNPIPINVNGKLTTQDPQTGGYQFGYRVPVGPAQGADADPSGPGGADTAWDCNDSGVKQDVNPNAVILSADLPPGVKLTLNVSVLESDNWDYLKAMTAAARIGNTIYQYASNPATAPVTVPKMNDVINGISKSLQESGIHFGNSDDHLGQTGLYLVTDANGIAIVETQSWGSGAVSWAESAAGQMPWTNQVHFKGDGSDYMIYFRGLGMRT